MTLQELLDQLRSKIDEDYANRVNDAAWVNGVWSWGNVLTVHREGVAVLEKIDEIKKLAERYEGI
jgi:hypothetical protein